MSRGSDRSSGGIPDIDPGPLYDQDEHVLRTEAPGEDVTDEQLRADATNPEGWLHYNKGPEMHGFSPASRLRPENVDTFEEQFEIEFPSTIYQCNPTVVPGDPPVMYVGLGDMSVYAINARTGEKYWKFGYSLENFQGVSGRTRGIAVRGDTAYLAATDLRLVAIDRYTGEFQWKTWLLSDRQREHVERPEKISQTQAPVAYEGTVMAGQTGEAGVFGALLGVDAETGELEWGNDICRPENWAGQSWRYGDGASWMSPAVDPENGLVFHPTGNAGVKFNGTVRPGPNRDANSIVAIDIETGEIEWSYQLLAQDWFDWDCTTTPRVFDLVVDGERRRVVAAEDKSGWSHIIDAATGQLVERTEPFAKQGGDDPDDLEFLSIPGLGPQNEKYMWPDDYGATNWSPDAYSPQTGLMYLGGNDLGQKFYWLPGYEFDPDRVGAPPGGVRGEFAGERACRVVAIDPAAAGEIAWSHEYDIDPSSGAQSGGTTATGGGLVFAGAATRGLVALDAETGEKRWGDDLGRVVYSSPVVWDDPVEERQYVAVSYDKSGARIKVYASEPGLEPVETPTPDPTPTASPTGTTSPSNPETDDTSGGSTDDSPGGSTDEDPETPAPGTDTSSEDGPGFGVWGALSGLGAAGAARKWLGDPEDESDES